VGTLWLAKVATSFGHPPNPPVTLSYFRLGWSQPDEEPSAEPLSQRFIRETGIHLKNLPVPEATLDQLALSRKLLEGGSGPDALGVDMIWAGVLAPDLMDLETDLAAELPLLNPQLVSSYMVDGRLVAIPYQVQVGVLEYRTDLLRAYHYDHPPRTWDEMESMAARVQAGERAKGNKNFWGYVWQGAAAEALTCNALEWQASEGGGQIIEANRTISVNNPAAIRSWQRAKSWIGRISPPGVVAYRESDSISVFDSGDALFHRVWGGAAVNRGGLSHRSHERNTLAVDKTGYTSLPSGRAGSAGTLGGSGLAISRRSAHPREAVRLVRFLIRAEIAAHAKGQPEPAGASSDDDSGIVIRPSSVTGRQYEQVTNAYIAAVHGVLTGNKKAPEAAADLETNLAQITGFGKGPPKTTE